MQKQFHKRKTTLESTKNQVGFFLRLPSFQEFISWSLNFMISGLSAGQAKMEHCEADVKTERGKRTL